MTRLALVRGQTARAGFFFTLAAVWRSSLHRLTIACAGAAGVAAAVVTLSGLDRTGCRRACGRHPDRGLCDSTDVLRRSAGGVPARSPCARRAAGQLGLPARVARSRARVPDRRATGGADRHRACRRWRSCCRCSGSCSDLPLAIAHAAARTSRARWSCSRCCCSRTTRCRLRAPTCPARTSRRFGIPYVVIFLIGASTFAGMERAALQDPVAAVRTIGLLTVMYVGLRVASPPPGEAAAD